jgi:hypothetical protein
MGCTISLPMALLLEVDSGLPFVEVSRQKWPSLESSICRRRRRRRASLTSIYVPIEPSFEPLIFGRMHGPSNVSRSILN